MFKLPVLRSSAKKLDKLKLIKTCSRFMSRGSSVSIVTELRTGRQGFGSQQWQGIFLFPTASRPALDSTQRPLRWVSRCSPRG